MIKPQLPKGHASILSPSFKYVPAVDTDLAKTFARIRAERRAPQQGGTITILKPKRLS